MMSFSESISTCLLEKVVTFDGRATRSEYWWYALFSYLVGPLISGGLMGTVYTVSSIGDGMVKALLVVLLALLILFQILFLCSNVCAAIRRLHDAGKNGLWIFISIIPIVGPIILLVFLIQESEKTDNKYGAYVSL